MNLQLFWSRLKIRIYIGSFFFYAKIHLRRNKKQGAERRRITVDKLLNVMFSVISDVGPRNVDNHISKGAIDAPIWARHTSGSQ